MPSPRKRKSDPKGFTFVELIVAISVVATLAVVGIAYGNSYKSEHNNAVRLSDVETLVLAADSYFQAKGDYPEPTGNRVYFDSLWAYSHSATGSYGVSSSATSDLFGSEFLAEVPRDPDTGNAYGYGKRKDGTAGYDVAAVDKRHDGYYAYVRGKYDASALPSLVREYNGPGFVEDGKSWRLPYNPTDSKITAKISAYGGSVMLDSGKPLTEELSEGDTVRVPAGGYAVLHVSDGTEARIGATDATTELKLENLNSKDSKRFLTKVRLALNGGEVWTKAPKLRQDRGESSEIEIVSGNAVASVRGTVFGVRKNGSSTDVTLAVGELKLQTESGNEISGTGIPEGIIKVEETDDPNTAIDETMPKSVTVNDAEIPGEDDVGGSVSAGGEIVEKPSARERLKEWEGAGKRETKPKSVKLSRDSLGRYSFSFQNDSGFSALEVRMANGSNSLSPVSTPSWTATVTILSLSASALEGYPTPSSTEYKKFPFRLTAPNGASASGEFVIPGGTEAFQIDENALPKGVSTGCSTGYRWYWKLGCARSNLVAYAPYDREGDLYFYDRRGQTIGNVVTDLVTGKDHKNVPYKKNFDRSATAANDVWTALYSTFGLRGIGLDLFQGDDYVGYDFSSLGINTSKIFVVEVSVSGRSLKRKFSEIDAEDPPPGISSSTNPSYNSLGERRAYLWALEDGTSLYLRAMSSEDAGDYGFLVLTGKDGQTKSTWKFSRSALKNEDRVSVSTRMGGKTPAGELAQPLVFMALENASVPVSGTFSNTESGTHRPDVFRRIWIGSSAPETVRSNGYDLLRWHSQWGGKKSSSINANGDWTGEIIDFVKISAQR